MDHSTASNAVTRRINFRLEMASYGLSICGIRYHHAK